MTRDASIDSVTDSPPEPEADAPGGPMIIGWREWVALPDLGLPGVKAKIDTGARTSSLHAFDIEEERADDGATLIAFNVQPLQRDDALVVRCRAPLVDQRVVTDSGGHAAERYVVSARLAVGDLEREVELTLVDRRGMLFRMLVGRTSLVPAILVDASRSFTLGRADVRTLYHQQTTGETP